MFELLYKTIEKNEHQYLRSLLTVNGKKSDNSDKRMNMLLRLSVELGHPKCCQILLMKSASVDCRNEYDETPLHVSAWYGHSDCCTLLLEQGASPNPKNSNG